MGVMDRATANLLLDRVRDGERFEASVIREALRVTGDLRRPLEKVHVIPTPESELVREDGWVERPRKS